MLLAQSLFHYFTDSVLRPNNWLHAHVPCSRHRGVIVFLRKQSLVGETLSHATYPGVILGVVAAASLSLTVADDSLVAAAIMAGAFLSAFAGLLPFNF